MLILTEPAVFEGDASLLNSHYDSVRLYNTKFKDYANQISERDPDCQWKFEILSDVSLLGRQAISLSHLLHLMLEQYKYSKDWSDEQLAFVFKRLILMMEHIDAGVRHSNYDYLNPKANDRDGNRYTGNSLDDLKTIRRGKSYCERYPA